MNNKYYDRISKTNIEDKEFFKELDCFALHTGRSYAMPDKEYRTIRRIRQVRDYLDERDLAAARIETILGGILKWE